VVVHAVTTPGYPQAVWTALETRIPGFHSWLVAAIAAFFGWLLVILLALAGVPVGWALLGAAAGTLALAALYARARRMKRLEVAGLTFVCITLEWLVLAVVTWAIALVVEGPGD
jgi:hypothetical protein